MLLVLYVVVGTASFVVGKTVTGIVVDNWLAMCVCGGFVCDAYVKSFVYSCAPLDVMVQISWDLGFTMAFVMTHSAVLAFFASCA